MFLSHQRKFFQAWFGTGFLSVASPLIFFWWARVSNRANRQQYDDNANNNNNNNYYNGVNNNNNVNNNANQAPWWWFGGDAARRREDGQATPTLGLVYVWSLVLFVVLLAYGHYVIRNGHYSALVASLAFFGNMALLNMFLLASIENTIQSEGDAMQEYGFYGQFGVLMFVTDAFWVFFSFAFAIIVRYRASYTSVTKIEVEPSDYQIAEDDETKPAV